MDLLEQLRSAEHHLLRHHGVRLRVDKVTADGRNVLCVAAQVKRSFLRSDLSSERLVRECHNALVPVYSVGLRPLISPQARDRSTHFKPIDDDDPFQLRVALRAADMEERLLPGYTLPPVSCPREATTTDDKVVTDRHNA